MNLNQAISNHLGLPHHKVSATVDLLTKDNTIPFIARYRKENTGNLDEEQIRNISEELKRLESLENRRQTVLQSIENQDKLTEALKRQILQADTITELEDIYLPYRPKRRTRAMVAREKGLQPLADMIHNQIVSNQSLPSLVSPFYSENVPDLDSAIEGACDIVAEMISENAIIRQLTREKGLSYGRIISEKVKDSEDERLIFEIYYQFSMPIKHIKHHQVLAINRGESEKILKVKIEINDRDWHQAIQAQYPQNTNSIFCETLIIAAEDAAKRLLLPSIERDIRRMLKDQAEEHAIEVFAQNLKALLTQPPLTGQVILAIDPGFRTGSKVVVIDPTGKLLDMTSIFPHPPQNKKADSYQTLNILINKHHVTLIVIGNGTASRETEMFVSEMTKSNPQLNYLITSEAGASVYSASKLARKEFPDLDVSIRGAISIGRRVQDPLAELVKIDPKSIGVGQYQHDIDQVKLTDTLNHVVESVVNAVGVEVNTASGALLTHVAGIGPSLAENIVTYREENGPFRNRTELLNVAGMGPKSFEQSAGFIRIRDGESLLDSTSIHPESYNIATQVIDLIGLSGHLPSQEWINTINNFKQQADLKEIAESMNAGLPTLEDILFEIARPGRDPREDLPKPILRKDILSMEDLSPQMQLKGTIRNVVDFGAFIDIGVKTDGLLHRSKIKRGTHLKVGDIIDVKILSIDHNRNRISLEMNERTD